MCTVRHYCTSFLGLATADSSLNNPACLKIHQNAVFSFQHALPGKKSRNLSIWAKFLNIFKLLPILFYSLHCQKSLIYTILRSKTPQPIQQILVNNQKKTHTFRLLPVRVFFLYTAKNHLSVLQSKMSKKHSTVIS